MDRKSIIALVACFIVLMMWFPLVNKMYPPKPLPRGATNASPVSAAGTNALAAPAQTSAPAAEAPTIAPWPVAVTNVPEVLLEVTNHDAHYTFTSRGGGLKEIELLQYPETVATRIEKQPEHPAYARLNKATPAPTLALLDGDAVQGDGVYEITRTASGGVHAEKALANGLVITKEFEFSSNYLVTTTVRFENRSAQPLALPPQEWVVGTATPLGPRDQGRAVGVLWYNGAKSLEVGGGTYFSSGGCSRRVPPVEYRGIASNVVWVAAHNQFFTLAAMPQAPAQDVIIRRIDLPRPTGQDARLVATNAPAPQGYEAAMVYPAFTLEPKGRSDRTVYLYIGPKEYQTLVRLADRFTNNIDLVMSFGWAGFVSKALLLGMNWMHDTLRFSYGWAIVAITVLIKAVFWPLTRASTRSMKRMQLLQPQAKVIQEKYKDDPMKAQRKVMDLYKEHKVSPLGGCLPMVIQIPVFFGFYQMIQGVIELRGASFLWVRDLSQSDTLFIIPGLDFIPIFAIPGVGLPFNLLPLLMGATMLWQARLSPPSPGMDPAQAKMMRYMPLIFMVGLYNFSAGLTLYWTVNNLLTIAQTKLTRTDPEPAGPPAGPVLTSPPKKRK